MPIYPYSGGRYEKFWKYENADPSTDYHAIKVAVEAFDEMLEKFRKRGKRIYGVREEAIIVQVLVHRAVREIAKISEEHVKLIEKYEKENSGKIDNYFDSEGVEHVPEEEVEEEEEGDNKATQGKGESETSGKFTERGDDDMEYDPE